MLRIKAVKGLDTAQAKALIDKYSSAFIPNPANATKRPQTEKLISDDIAKLSSSDLQSLKTQLDAIPDDNLDGGGDDGAKATLLAKVNLEIGKRNPEKSTAQELINKYSSAFIPNPNNMKNRENTEKAIAEDVSKMSPKDLADFKNQLSSIPDQPLLVGGGGDAAKHAILNAINSEITKRGLDKPTPISAPTVVTEKPTAQGLINKYVNSFHIFKSDESTEAKAKSELQSSIGQLSNKYLEDLKNQMKSVSYGGRSNVGVYNVLNEIIDAQMKMRGM